MKYVVVDNVWKIYSQVETSMHSFEMCLSWNWTFLATFFCAASEEKSFCMQSHTLVDPCVKNCYPKEIIIILHVVLHDSVHTM